MATDDDSQTSFVSLCRTSSPSNTSFSDVRFVSVAESYLTDTPLHCRVQLCSLPRPGDEVGLIKIGWKTAGEVISKVPVTALTETEGCREEGCITYSVIFDAGVLPRDDGEFFQFCYLSVNTDLSPPLSPSTTSAAVHVGAACGISPETPDIGTPRLRVLGTSAPFQFSDDDFEILDQPSLGSMYVGECSGVDKAGVKASVDGPPDDRMHISAVVQRSAELQTDDVKNNKEDLQLQIDMMKNKDKEIAGLMESRDKATIQLAAAEALVESLKLDLSAVQRGQQETELRASSAVKKAEQHREEEASRLNSQLSGLQSSLAEKTRENVDLSHQLSECHVELDCARERLASLVELEAANHALSVAQRNLEDRIRRGDREREGLVKEKMELEKRLRLATEQKRRISGGGNASPDSSQKPANKKLSINTKPRFMFGNPYAAYQSSHFANEMNAFE